jgi:lipopolysaccharide transport system ATP-binding protein
MKPILEIQDVSKKFRIRHETQPYLSMRESLGGIFRKNSTIAEDFWALRNVNFNVNAGESVGIIGRNGAGKSTLLKVLSKITPPTSGRIIGRGRIASLLEVGTGFHPELTGRENIYLNGSILGMKKREIDRQFDAIVAFAGTEKFLDTPLKHYSSGMQLRLAFAVAAFLEPEILIIDEVLAVGDAEFQKKCLGKMEDVSKSGRTILFVSHNMAAIESICKEAILLKDGRIEKSGPSREITRAYLRGAETSSGSVFDQKFPLTSAKAQIIRLEFLSEGRPATVVSMGCDLMVRMHFRSSIDMESYMMGLILYDAMGAPILFFNNKNYGVLFDRQEKGGGMITAHIMNLNLMPGLYSLDIHFASLFEDLDVKKSCFTFQVVYKAFEGAGEPLREEFNRIFYKDVSWTMEATN